MKFWLSFATGVMAAAVLAGVAGILFMYSGFYDIAANEPHLGPVRWLLVTGRTRSVEFHSRGIESPRLADAELIRRGFGLYREHCLVCHGAPGVRRWQLGRGINPTPPPMLTAAFRWTDAQVYWILTHGLKMSGMPGFAVQFSETDRWAVVAFVRRMQWLSPQEYAAMSEGAGHVQWVVQGDQGLAEMRRTGNVQRGRELVRAYGCASCHVIPETGFQGTVGPPLRNFAERHFIAGKLVNTPKNLVAWILEPAAIEPGTAMPDVGATYSEALDITAYLYTLGSSERLDALVDGPLQERASRSGQ